MTIPIERLCNECGGDNGLVGHKERCHIDSFIASEAWKYDLVSIMHRLTPKFTFNYVSGNLKNVYPRVVSKIFESKHGVGGARDIFVEQWGVTAIQLFIDNDGYAGMNLAEFLDKMAHERNAKPKSS